MPEEGRWRLSRGFIDQRGNWLARGLWINRSFDRGIGMRKMIYKPGYSEEDIMLCTKCGDAHSDTDRVEGKEMGSGDIQILCPKCGHTEAVRYDKAVWERIKSL